MVNFQTPRSNHPVYRNYDYIENIKDLANPNPSNALSSKNLILVAACNAFGGCTGSSPSCC